MTDRTLREKCIEAMIPNLASYHRRARAEAAFDAILGVLRESSDEWSVSASRSVQADAEALLAVLEEPS